MNVKSIEYGWLLKDHGFEHPRQMLGLSLHERGPFQIPGTEEVGLYGECLCLETHPWQPDYMFVSMDDVGEEIPKEPEEIGRKVRAWIHDKCPRAKVIWGIIHTER